MTKMKGEETFLHSYLEFDFYSISSNSKWWAEIIKYGYKYNREFVPSLSDRMPIEEYFARFQSDKGFTIVAIDKNEFVGCLCNFFNHPETNRPWYQCIIINKKYRQNKLAHKFYELSDNILKEKSELFVQGRTWVENIKNRRALKSIGFYQIETLINDRGVGIHTLLYEKCLFNSEYFKGIKRLGILGGLGSIASAKFFSDICHLTSQTEKEQEQLPITVHSETQTPDRTELILSNRKPELVKLLNHQIKSLLDSNCSHIVICCFSYHSVINEIDQSIRVHVVSLIDYTTKLLENKKGTYLSLATLGSYKLNLLGHIDNILYPNEADQSNVHDCIYRIKKGEPKELVLIDLEKIIQNYNCTGIVLGCTDLYLLTDHFELYFKYLEIISPLKVLTYDITNNYKVNEAKHS